MGEIKAACPDCIIRTTVMVGFPGESEEGFTSLCDSIKRWGVDIIGAFIYSREEGTKASRIKGHIKSNIKKARFEKVMELQNEILRKRLQRLIGSKTKVIVEEEGERFNTGRILEQAPDIDGMAFIKGRCIKGEIRGCKVVKTLDYDVVVELEI
jgi:ribosomal protein S12 methylthiotransferase